MAKIRQTGFGTVGYCKLCSFDDPVDQDAFDKRIGKRENDDYVYTPAALNEWLEGKGLQPVNRQTIYSHRKHVMHPKDRLVSAVVKRQIEHGVQPAQVSEDSFLDALIAIGQQRIAADPDSVTIDQALKAVQVKRQSSKAGQAQQVLVNIFTGGPTMTPVVEGEVREL